MVTFCRLLFAQETILSTFYWHLQLDDEGNKVLKEYQATGAEGQGIDKYYVTNSEAILKEAYRGRPKPPVKDGLDEDERWAMGFEASLKKAADSNAIEEKPRKDSPPSSRDRYHRESRERHRSRRHHERSRSYSRDRRRRRSSSRDRHRHRRRYSRSSEGHHRRRSYSVH